MSNKVSIKILLAILVSSFALTVGHANVQAQTSSNTLNSDTPQTTLRCSSVRCRNRQYRRIRRANCRLDGGIRIGGTCHAPQGGN